MTNLDASLAAFRAQTDAPPRPDVRDGTLQRILDAHLERRRRRLAMALAVSFATAGSAVAVVGVRSRAPREAKEWRPASAATQFAPPASANARSAVDRQPPEAATPVRSPSPLLATAPVRARRPSDPLRAEDDLFAQGQRLHASSPGSADELAAWTSYLAEYPDGRFAPEARYRRAVALTQLGEWDSARSALAPFVDGTYGDYRRDEAAEWLRSIPKP